MASLTVVGQNHRPPADLLWPLLPGTSVFYLVEEPTNAHDPFAIKVLLPPQTLRQVGAWELDSALEGTQWTRRDLLAACPLHVGYVSRDQARSPTLHAKLAKGPLKVTLVFSKGSR